MTIFLRLLADKNKADALISSVAALRAGHTVDARTFEVAPHSFKSVPGAPFAYWVSEAVRMLYLGKVINEWTSVVMNGGHWAVI